MLLKQLQLYKEAIMLLEASFKDPIACIEKERDFLQKLSKDIGCDMQEGSINL